MEVLQALLPPQTPHASTVALEPTTLSQPTHALAPPHTPQRSNAAPELGRPSQPAQKEPSPSHTPQGSAPLRHGAAPDKTPGPSDRT